jgi:nucleoside-diphosphate-sugar epimerase
MDGKSIAVIGYTGSFGGAVGRELARRGHRVRALVRDVDKARRAAGGLPVEWVRGDVDEAGALGALFEGADVLVFGLNVPYERWEAVMPRVSERVFDEAARRGVTVVFPGNVYGLGKGGMAEGRLDEASPKVATSRKGRLRNRLEAMLAERAAGAVWAKERGWPGLRAIVLRAGDYFGEAEGTWFGHIVKGALSGKGLRWPSRLELGHTWAYLPDLAVAAAELVERRERLASYEELCFAGHHVTGEVMAGAIAEALGLPGLRAKPMPWGLMQLARPFSAFVRELFDVRYVWTEAMPLDDRKLARVLGSAPMRTPLSDAVGRAVGELAAATGSAQVRHALTAAR